MAAINPTLFDWDAVESRSDLDRFLLVRDHLPDARLVQYLEVMRAHGRNDYPVRALWNALIAGIVFQPPSISALIRELDRNPALLQAAASIHCRFNTSQASRWFLPMADSVRLLDPTRRKRPIV